MRKIYILLTKSNTILSRGIYLITRGEYTHASISLDTKFEMLYSFGRKYKHLILPAGFVKESVNHGVLGDSDDMKCAVYELEISEKAYKRLLRILDHMDKCGEKYRYSILGLPMCFFKKKYERKGYFFCSQFVYYALSKSGAVKKRKEPSLVRPIDLKEIPEAKEIFKGNISQLRSLQITGETA